MIQPRGVKGLPAPSPDWECRRWHPPWGNERRGDELQREREGGSTLLTAAGRLSQRSNSAKTGLTLPLLTRPVLSRAQTSDTLIDTTNWFYDNWSSNAQCQAVRCPVSTVTGTEVHNTFIKCYQNIFYRLTHIYLLSCLPSAVISPDPMCGRTGWRVKTEK